MENKVLTTIKEFKNKTLILSVSGGVDSLVLFDLLYKNNLDIVVVHFNHLLREQAHDEANYIKNLCQQNNIKLHYFELKIKTKKNFHDQAHKLRRKHLQEVADLYNTNIIVTAHHLNDLAESVILKLSRGSNLLGYSGMNISHYKNGYYFLKPLLNITKNELLNYAKINNIYYYDDSSNFSDDYMRNKIRHHVIPYLIDQNPQFLNKVSQYNQTLLETFHFIRKQAIDFLNNKEFFMITNFLQLEKVIQKEVISYLLENNNISPSLNKINNIIKFFHSSGPNDSLDIGQGYLFLRCYNKASLTKIKANVPFKQQLYFNQENFLPNGSIINFNNTIDETMNNEINLCYNRLVVPLWARTRRNGDTLYFSYGHKKLKDFFIDKKIPKHIRDSSVIITDNNDQIIAVLGLYENRNPNLKDKIKLIYERK